MPNHHKIPRGGQVNRVEWKEKSRYVPEGRPLGKPPVFLEGGVGGPLEKEVFYR